MNELPYLFMFYCRIYMQLRHDQSDVQQVIDAGYCIDHPGAES